MTMAEEDCVEATGVYRRCMKSDCHNVADAEIDVVGSIKGTLVICSSCRTGLLDGYQRLQAAAQTLRDQGLSDDALDRIMCERVEAGEFH